MSSPPATLLPTTHTLQAKAGSSVRSLFFISHRCQQEGYVLTHLLPSAPCALPHNVASTSMLGPLATHMATKQKTQRHQKRRSVYTFAPPSIANNKFIYIQIFYVTIFSRRALFSAHKNIKRTSHSTYHDASAVDKPRNVSHPAQINFHCRGQKHSRNTFL